MVARAFSRCSSSSAGVRRARTLPHAGKWEPSPDPSKKRGRPDPVGMAAGSNSHDWAGPRSLCTLYRYTPAPCSAGCLLAPGPNPLAYICYRPNTWMAVTPHMVLCMPCSNQAQGGDRSVARRRIPADRGAGLLFLLACCALSNKAGFWYYCTPPAAHLSG